MYKGEMMNVYEKLSKARIELQGMNLKKSGQNKFAGYSYYELGDYLPTINKLMDKMNMICQVSFTHELATMTVRDLEKPEDTIVFTSPFGSANLKGCHEVQNIGAVETYQRRYLYQVAFEIVEHDALDASMNPDEIVYATQEQRIELETLATNYEGAQADYLNKASAGKGLTYKKAEQIIKKASEGK